MGRLDSLVHLSRVLLALIIAVYLLPAASDPDAERLRAELPPAGCAAPAAPVDHGRALEELHHAYEWNRLLAGSPLMAIDHDYYSGEEVLARVDGWLPLIACIAREFDEPPELLAGIIALELDLDYHLTDAVIDSLLRSPWGGLFGRVEIGAGYAGVHFGHLRPALATLGAQFSTSPFYQDYYRLIMTRSDADLTLLATRNTFIDLADAALMARYYARLRLGQRPWDSMTIDDMAFTWSAYRGGVVGSVADPRPDSRWSLDYLQQADNPHVFGDTIIALPYFSYYRAVYGSAHVGSPDTAGVALMQPGRGQP
jgi:hypothetical protein